MKEIGMKVTHLEEPQCVGVVTKVIPSMEHPDYNEGEDGWEGGWCYVDWLCLPFGEKRFVGLEHEDQLSVVV